MARTQFMIKLNDSEVDSQRTVPVVFSRIAGKDGRLAINGEASGANVTIIEINGKPLPLGTETQPIKRLPGNNDLVTPLCM